jgi:transcriptional regulator with XRE-family HTH domain
MQKNQKTRSPDPRDREVGQRIRAQRLIRKMSQEELGDSLGITFQQIQKYEKGANRVAAGRLIKIAEVLNMPVGFFLEGAAGPAASANNDGVNSALSFLKTAGAVRLLRAYNRIDTSEVRQALVELAEQIAGREDARSNSKSRKSA